MEQQLFHTGVLRANRGAIFIDGRERGRVRSCVITPTATNNTIAPVGQYSDTVYTTHLNYTFSLQFYRTDNFINEYITKTEQDLVLPELTIVGMIEDPASVYQQAGGETKFTLYGCKLTTLPSVIAMDESGETQVYETEGSGVKLVIG